MKAYSDAVKRRIKMMLNSPDWGERFYNEHGSAFFNQMISTLTETSQYPLDKLPVKEDSQSRWLAYFHFDYQTGKKEFAFNKRKILSEEGTSLSGHDANRERQLNAIFQLMVTCCHEFRHYEQSYIESVKNMETLDPMAILFAKEAILLREDNEFYKKNHDSFVIEMDAMAKAFGEINGILSSMDYKTKDMERIIRNCDSYMASYNKQIADYKKRGGFVEEISTRFDHIMKTMSPSKRSMYMARMPILTLVYNQDGSKKTYREIMGQKNKFIQAKRNMPNSQDSMDSFMSHLDSVYSTIIDCDRSLRKQKDDDYQSKEIKRDPYGISYADIEREKKKIESSKGVGHSR